MAVVSVVEPLPGTTFRQVPTFQSEMYLLTSYELSGDLVLELPESARSIVSSLEWQARKPEKIAVLSKISNFTEQPPYHVYRWDPQLEGVPYVLLSGPDILPVFRPLNPLSSHPETYYENRLAVERMSDGFVSLEKAGGALLNIGDGISLKYESGEISGLAAMEVWGGCKHLPGHSR